MTISYNAAVSLLTNQYYGQSSHDYVMKSSGEMIILDNLINEWKKNHPAGPDFNPNNPEARALLERYLIENYPELVPVGNEMKEHHDAALAERMAIVEKYRNSCPETFEIGPASLANEESAKKAI